MVQLTASYPDDIPEDQALVKAGETLRHNGNESVLLIDDEEDLVEEVGDYLGALGYRISSATSGTAGLAMLEQAAPDAVVCDVSMPGMNGHQVLQAIRARGDRFANIPFLFLTAYGAHDDHVAGLGVGADDFIAKPAQLSIIAARLRARIDQAARFRKDADTALKSISERIETNITRRQRKLIDSIQQLIRAIEEIDTSLTAITTISELQTDVAELASRAMKSVGEAATHAEAASILAHVPPMPSSLSPQPCNIAAVMMDAMRGTFGIMTGAITLHVENGPELIADAAQIRSLATSVATWVSSLYPGVTLRAEAKPAERGIMLSFAVESRTPEAVALAWSTLARRSIADADDQSPADIAMSESIQALHSAGGQASADIRENEAVLNLNCVYS